MTTNHIDQLAEWYAQAESGPVNVGDTVIYRHAGQWIVDVSTVPYDNPDNRDIRILARAPKRKPAWHDAVAVIAHTARFSERRPFALTHTEDVLDPYNTEWITRDDLLDPVPLIEAKVTDEMVERLEGHFLDTANMALPAGLAHRMLHAALGLEAA